MRKFKKTMAYVLAFITVFSSFTILPNGVFDLAVVYGTDLTAENTSTEQTSEKQTYTEGDFTYSIINENEVEIVSYNGTSTDVVIPDITTGSEFPILANKKVTVIGDAAFKDKGLKSVIFGKNIVTIGDYAFEGYTNTLIEVDLSVCTNLTTIGDYAFSNFIPSRIETLTLPDSLKTIGDCAFAYCKIRNLEIGKNIEYIGGSAFYRCPIYTLNIKGGKDAIIGDSAFSDCVAKSITIGDGVKTIGRAAFAFCTINSLSLGNTVEIIEEHAFVYSGISELIIPDNVKFIGYRAFADCFYLKNISIGSGCTSIDLHAFNGNKALENINVSEDNPNYTMVDGMLLNKNKTQLIEFLINKKGMYTIPDTVTSIADYASTNFYYYGPTELFILSKNLYTIGKYGLLNDNTCTIYCYKNSRTHQTLKNHGYTNLKFFTSEIHQTDIKINGTSVGNFSTETKDYTVYLDDITYVNIAPVFEEADVNYTVTSENNVYTINIYDENDELKDTYKVTVKEHGYTVTGDINVMLNPVSATKVGGSIALPAGTYKLKIAKDLQQFGYNKTVSDYCNGLSLSEKYVSHITLNATGGTYTFQFDTSTNKLVIKYDSNMPNEYLVGDLDTILKPVTGKTLAIGSQNLKPGTYKFKLSIGGTEYGYNATVNDATTGSLSLSSEYKTEIALNATGGMYTFVLNTSTNRLEIRHIPTADESKEDVHISGDFNLVLNDKSADGTDLTTATGTITLNEGTYTFKVHNYGIVYTAGTVINNKATKNLSSKYITPVTLNATGGTYKFVFNKETGALVVSLLT